jgi:hypothetical protein
MLARLRGVTRIHKVSLRLPFVPLSYLVQVCKGLVQERIDEQGPESLVRKQKEPLRNWMIVRWLTTSRGIVGSAAVGNNLPWQRVFGASLPTLHRQARVKRTSPSTRACPSVSVIFPCGTPRGRSAVSSSPPHPLSS